MPLLQRIRSYTPHRIYGLLLFLVSLVFVGCRKKDEEPPVLSINLLGPSSFQFEEAIPFSVSATDNEQLVSLVVLIQSVAGTSVLESRTFDTQSASSFSAQSSIEHNDRYLSSGNYLLKAIASDGENESITFREIYLYELPISVQRYFVLQTVDQDNTKVDSLQLNGSVYTATNLNLGLDIAQCNSHQGTLLVGGREFEGVSTWDGMELTLLNLLNTPSNVSPDYFNDVFYDEESFTHYVLSGDGYIRNIRGDGTVKKTIQTSPFIPEYLTLADEYLLVLEHNLLETEQRISIYYSATGTFLQAVDLDFEPKVILEDLSNDSEFWILGNQNGTAITRKYSLTSGQVFDPNGIQEIGESSPIITALRLPDGRPVISHEAGTFLYNSSYTGGGMMIGSSTSQLLYEPVQDQIFILENGQLTILQNGSFSEVQSYSLLPGHSVVSILYNK